MAVLYSKEKGKLGTLTGSIINWSNQLTSSDPEDTTLYETLPAGYLRCDGTVYQAEVFPELAVILGTGAGCRYKKPDTTLLDNQFQVPDLSAKSTKTSFSANLGDYVDTYLDNDAGVEITKSGVGMEVSSNIGTDFDIQYQGNFFLPSQTIEITGQPGFTKSSGNYTEEIEVLHTAFQPHAHFHDGKRSRIESPISEFALFGRNSKQSKTTLCIMPWANNTNQPLCQAEASRIVAKRITDSPQTNGTRTHLVQCFGIFSTPPPELHTWYGACWSGCNFSEGNKCLIPGDIPEQNLDGTETGNILQFECSSLGSAIGYPIYDGANRPADGAVPTNCGNVTYFPEMSCKTENRCGIGGDDCDQFDNAINGTNAYAKPDPNYLPNNYLKDGNAGRTLTAPNTTDYGPVAQATQVPFDSQANNITYGALNNVVTDVEEFGTDGVHKHLVPFNQDPHTFNVVTQPTYIPGGNLESSIKIDVNEENKADAFIQPFLVQEFLIKY